MKHRGNHIWSTCRILSLAFLLWISLPAYSLQEEYTEYDPQLGGVTITAEFSVFGVDLEPVLVDPEGFYAGTGYDHKFKGAVRPGQTITVTVRGIRANGNSDGYKASINVNDVKDKHQDLSGGMPSATVTYTVPDDVSVVYINMSFHNLSGIDAGHSTGSFTVKIDAHIELDVSKDAPEPKDSHIVIDDDAPGFEGEWPWTIPLSVVVAMLGYVATKNGGKKKDYNPLDRIELRIYKEFGNSLLVGEKPRQVFARIVRIPHGGDEHTDMALTQMIQISAGDQYMQVQPSGMAGEWQSAWISAPELPPGQPVPEEGIVRFYIGNAGGSFTNNLHFQIEVGKFLFGQDNLTLPAHYDKTTRLPFVAVGLPDAAPVDAKVVDTTGKPTDFYSAKVVWNAEKQVHEVLIIDRKQDPKMDNGKAGNFINFDILLTAKTPSGRVMDTRFPLVRYYMGLAFKLKDQDNHVKCYTEEYNPQKHKKCLVGNKRNGKLFVPAESAGQLLLYDYDEDAHRVVISAVVPHAFSIKAVNEVDDRQVQGIGLFPDFTDTKGNYTASCVLRCMEGVLDAPSRLDAVITFEATVENRKYSCETQVLLCSQPWRTFQSDAEWAAAIKADEETKAKLNALLESIERQGLTNRLMPIVKYIDNLIYGYEVRYGFDQASLHFVGVMYNHMLTDRAAYTFNETVPLSLCDDLLECARLTFEQYARPIVNATNKFNEQYGTAVLVGRIAVGFWTYGASEAYFRAYDALSLAALGTTLTDIYIESGNEELTKNLWVMAKEMGKMQILMTGVSIGLHVGFSGLRAKYNPKVSASTLVKPGDIKPKTPAKPTKGQYSSAKKGRITREAINESNQLQAKAAADVKAADSRVKVPKTEAEKYTDARAVRNIEDLHAAIEMCNENPTPENLALKRRLCIELQADPTAKHMLRQLDAPEYTMVKAEFNREWYGINAKVDKAVISELALRNGLRPDQIKTENVSTSKTTQLLTGDTMTMDRDVTYYYLNAKGEKVYFKQSATEQLYRRTLHKEALGYEAHSQAAADKFGKKVDHTVIEDVLHHQESFGPDDVGRLMDPKRHGESLQNPNKVSDAIIWKSQERFESAGEKLKLAETLSDPIEKMEMQRSAINDLKEGAYMTAKDGDNFVIPMDIARKDVNGGLLVSDKLRHAIEHCRLVDKENINISELQARLQSQGYTFESLATDLGETMRRIGSPKLSPPPIPRTP